MASDPGVMLYKLPLATATSPNASRVLPLAATFPPAKVPLALPDIPTYTKEIESIRMLPFKAPVLNGRQSLAEFRQFIQKDLDYDLPPPRAACVSRSLGLLGLLPEDFDLRKAFSQLLVTQVAAYYNPYKKMFFIVHPELPDSFLKPTVVHELTHALQDQQFGLEPRIKALRKANNDDMENAFRFLAEGEATYVMVLATIRGHGLDLEAGGITIDQAIEAMSGLGREGIIAQVESTKDALGPSMAAEVDAVLSYPDFLFRTLFDPYFSGQRAVHHVFRDGGWEVVNQLWANPPISTEMFLHPEKLEKGAREQPVTVHVPDLSAALGPGYTSGCENTLGELEIEILFETSLPVRSARRDAGDRFKSFAEPEAAASEQDQDARGKTERAKQAAAGWGGDRYRAFERNGGGTVVVWRTVWDTEQDAIEFEEALREASRARLVGARPVSTLDLGAGAPSAASSPKSPEVQPVPAPAAAAPKAAPEGSLQDGRDSRARGVTAATNKAPNDAAKAVGNPSPKPPPDGTSANRGIDAARSSPPPGWIAAPSRPAAGSSSQGGSPAPPGPGAGSSAQAGAERGFLLVRQGKEALFVAGADIDQARAILAALSAPSLAPPLTGPASALAPGR